MAEAANEVAEVKVAEGNEEVAQTWSPEVETQARRLNWAPLTQWRGKPEDWQPPDVFLKSIEHSAPFHKANAKRLEAELGLVRERQQLTEKALHQLVEGQAQTLKQALASKVKELKIQQAEAITAGETAKAVDLSEQIDEARDQLRAPPAVQQQTTQIDPQVKAYFEDEWKPNNAWFQRDKEATQYAEELADRFMKRGYSREALLDKISEQMRTDRPELYGQATSRVEETTRSGGDGRKYVPTSEEAEIFNYTKDTLVGEGKSFKTDADYWKAYAAEKRSRA